MRLLCLPEKEPLVDHGVVRLHMFYECQNVSKEDVTAYFQGDLETLFGENSGSKLGGTISLALEPAMPCEERDGRRSSLIGQQLMRWSGREGLVYGESYHKQT